MAKVNIIFQTALHICKKLSYVPSQQTHTKERKKMTHATKMTIKKRRAVKQTTHLNLIPNRNHLFSSAIIRAMYLPMISNSRFTTLPSTILWKLVCS